MIVICSEKEGNSTLLLTQFSKCDGALLDGLLDDGSSGAPTERTASKDILK